MPDPAVICVAPNGSRRTKRDHPAIPLSPAEISRDAAACVEAGARVLHLHVRDSNGIHTLAPALYEEAIRAIRGAVGDALLIQVTTESAGRYAPPAQMALVRSLMPEAASIAVRELIPEPDAEDEAARFLAWAAAMPIALQFVLHSPDDVTRLVDLVNRGVVSNRAPHGLTVVGRHDSIHPAEGRDLLPFLDRWPASWPWTACAFGSQEAGCLAAAVGLGGHVRVGFENNVHAPSGLIARDNAELVRNARSLIAASGRPLATLDQAKQIYLHRAAVTPAN